jgi:hypothetical protein
MHGQPKPATLPDQVAKNVILESLVFLRRGEAARVIFLIDGGRGRTRWIGKIQRAEVAGLEFLGNPTGRITRYPERGRSGSEPILIRTDLDTSNPTWLTRKGGL